MTIAKLNMKQGLEINLYFRLEFDPRSESKQRATAATK